MDEIDDKKKSGSGLGGLISDNPMLAGAIAFGVLMTGGFGALMLLAAVCVVVVAVEKPNSGGQDINNQQSHIRPHEPVKEYSPGIAPGHQQAAAVEPLVVAQPISINTAGEKIAPTASSAPAAGNAVYSPKSATTPYVQRAKGNRSLEEVMEERKNGVGNGHAVRKAGNQLSNNGVEAVQPTAVKLTVGKPTDENLANQPTQTQVSFGNTFPPVSEIGDDDNRSVISDITDERSLKEEPGLQAIFARGGSTASSDIGQNGSVATKSSSSTSKNYQRNRSGNIGIR